MPETRASSRRIPGRGTPIDAFIGNRRGGQNNDLWGVVGVPHFLDEKVKLLDHSRNSIFLSKDEANASVWIDQTCNEKRANSISTLTTLFLHAQPEAEKLQGRASAYKCAKINAKIPPNLDRAPPYPYETAAVLSLGDNEPRVER